MGFRARLKHAILARPALLGAVRTVRLKAASAAVVACGPWALRRALDGGGPEVADVGAVETRTAAASLELYALRALCDRAVARAEEERLLRLAAERRLEELEGRAAEAGRA